MVVARRFAIALVASAALLSSAAACRSATEITFTVTTDIDCGAIKDTSFAVGDLAGIDTRPAATIATTCDSATHRIGSVVVVPSGSSSADVAVRIVTGIDLSAEDCLTKQFKGGCVVARRDLHFIPHTPLDVPIKMEAACRDVPCDNTHTCVAGACVSNVTSCVDTSCNLAGSGNSVPPTKWKPMASSSTAGISGRANVDAIWTGTEMIVWGGSPNFNADGGAYNPATNTWRLIPRDILGGRLANSAVWTGTEMIIWGGNLGPTDNASITGGRYNPATGSWKATAPPPTSFSGRTAHGAVWFPPTGEMIVFQGQDPAYNKLADGAAYKPSTDTWRIIAQSPLSARTENGMVVAGSKVVAYGGYCTNCDDYAIYDPAADTWSDAVHPSIPGRIPAVIASDGTTAFFWGGSNVGGPPEYGTGVAVNPASSVATVIDDPPTSMLAIAGREGAMGFANAGTFWIWGGYQQSPTGVQSLLADGASYSTTTQAWVSAMPSEGAPSQRREASSVWAGTQGIVWGGLGINSALLDDGAIFGP